MSNELDEKIERTVVAIVWASFVTLDGKNKKDFDDSLINAEQAIKGLLGQHKKEIIEEVKELIGEQNGRTLEK